MAPRWRTVERHGAAGDPPTAQHSAHETPLPAFAEAQRDSGAINTDTPSSARAGVPHQIREVALTNAPAASNMPSRAYSLALRHECVLWRVTLVGTKNGPREALVRPVGPSRSGYQRGCRCDDCRAVAAAFMRHRRGSRQPKQHGTDSAYMNHGCLCRLCKAAGSDRGRRERERRRGLLVDGIAPPNAPHGTYSCYQVHFCRCAACCTAGREWHRRARARRKENR